MIRGPQGEPDDMSEEFDDFWADERWLEEIEEAEVKQNKSKPKPGCYFCNAEVTEDEFCYGCIAYVCDKCNAPLDERPWSGRNKHVPEMHRKAS